MNSVGANLHRMDIGPASAPTRPSTMDCAKSATKRGGQEKQIPTAGEIDNSLNKSKGR